MAAVPAPRPMGYADVPAAVNTTVDALNGDPLQRYLFDTPDFHDTVATRASRKAELTALWGGLVTGGGAWTIDDGKGVIGYRPAKDSSSKWRWNDIYGFIVPRLFFYKTWLLTKEQNKRRQEVKEKYDKAIEDALGSRKDSMIYLDIVMVAKEAQGHGHGSTLVKLVTDKADEEGLSVWLISSNIANEGFYNRMGFKTKEIFVLGNDNPTWTEPLVKVCIMVREFGDSSTGTPVS